LEIYAPSDYYGRYRTVSLNALLPGIQSGFHAFYADPAMVDESQISRAVRDVFLEGIKQENNIVDACSFKQDAKPAPKKLYLLGRDLPKDYAAQIGLFLRKLREVSAQDDSPFQYAAGFALHQASVYDLVGDRHQQSAVIANTLGYNEYLLWDDGGLWIQADWDRQVATWVTNQAFENSIQDDGERHIKAEQRLAWLGSGAISLQLHHLCFTCTDAWPYPQQLEQILTATIERLERYDQALLTHYQSTESRQPPGYQKSDYVRLLCNFLPDHRSRLKHDEFLSSNSLGDDGGPRPWGGVDDWRLHMQLIHLLLDGLLTLWPISPTETEEGSELVLQPGSLAILYWAARTAGMPWTDSPDNFLRNYRWDDNRWFGGRRQHWFGQESAA
jgi:hypothetical protein